MNTLIQDNNVIRVMLESTDTLGDMAMVSGCTMDKLRCQIENLINESIWDEVNRDYELEGGEDDEA